MSRDHGVATQQPVLNQAKWSSKCVLVAKWNYYYDYLFFFFFYDIIDMIVTYV